MKHDVIIVGGGFAGLSAALPLARARRHVLLIDTARPRNRFAASSHNFLGQEGVAPLEIQRIAAEQLAPYATFRRMQGEAVAARQEDGGFLVSLADGQAFWAARLILASGVRDELPAIDGLEARWGHTVVHCPYCHGYELRDRPLGVLADQPMAAAKAAMLPDWGEATLFTQGLFEPDAEQRALLDARGVRIERTPIEALLGEAPELDGVRLKDGRSLALGGLFVASRVHMTHPLAEQLGCAMEEGANGFYLKVDDWKQTSVPGVFAAGDIATPMHSAILAAAAGNLAAVGAHVSLVRAVLE
ncbi:NAD(P)/FAD-dependent oxidoreductase [Pseudomonas sp. LRF_L74]|uniref:NAD(P)/FAD-dependent oxidoreductase n=1 Tax=Pseudomonas sp. LRF_L74 TaxID=3369422 RepID=UPI003F63409E